ncbi:DUF4139 domain-containing protein [Erythrobacter neustonensis]|uniref:DUF4139 domain-containing protein n=1 Tax=Erythrobacter neustonensis TaxID=1112 RepID=A0A192D701_9SPHN|nr:DUF4139 domain-containing protein [Erythrobacter neustonensis]ANK13806.1 DUF4139 domain-containing protein [Erythrobacter neustonensis]
MNIRAITAGCGMSIGIALASGALASAAAAQAVPDPDATAQGDVSLTIYNNNLALVQDVRNLAIAQGNIRIELPDVSAQIRPETLSFAAAGTTIVEQNFDYDLLTPAKLMEKAVGQTVTLLRTNPATGTETRERAKVLSVAGGTVIQIGERIEVLRDDGLPVRVIFDRVPPGLRARPTLSVSLDSARGGTRPVSLRYLTGGLGWSADYVALYNEGAGTIDMQGWVTLTNNTGTTFHKADTVLVAGNPSGGGNGYGYNQRGVVRPGTQAAARERLGDFYLYPISGRTTVANDQTKQVSFLDVQAVPARKIYAATAGFQQNDEEARNVQSRIAFSSSRDQGLGDALPAGTVRFYQRDRENTPQFIGENAIGHTPMGSELSLVTGDAFDITIKAEVEKRETITSAEWEKSARYRVTDGARTRTITLERPKTFYRTTMRYTLTNAKSAPVEVELLQTGLDRGWWADDFRITSEDLPGEQINADQRRYKVPVPAEGERVIRVTYETRY